MNPEKKCINSYDDSYEMIHSFRPYLLTNLTDRTVFWRTHLDIERNSYVRFRQNSNSGCVRDAIRVKIKGGIKTSDEVIKLSSLDSVNTRISCHTELYLFSLFK